jgi:hypothetical protein
MGEDLGDKKKLRSKDDYGELYSESSSFESQNGRQTKSIIDKVYKKNDKYMHVRRE